MTLDKKSKIIFYGAKNSGKTAYFLVLYRSSNASLNLKGQTKETISSMNRLNSDLDKGILPEATSLLGVERDFKITYKTFTKNFNIDISFIDISGEVISEHATFKITQKDNQDDLEKQKNYQDALDKFNEHLQDAIGICYIIPYHNTNANKQIFNLLPDALELALSKYPDIPFSILVTKFDEKYPQQTLSNFEPNFLNEEADQFLKKNYETVYNKLCARKTYKVFAVSILDQYLSVTQPDIKDYIKTSIGYRKISGFQVLPPIEWILEQHYLQKTKDLPERILGSNNLNDNLKRILDVLKYYQTEEDLHYNQSYQLLKNDVNNLFKNNIKFFENSKITNSSEYDFLIENPQIQKFFNLENMNFLNTRNTKNPILIFFKTIVDLIFYVFSFINFILKFLISILKFFMRVK